MNDVDRRLAERRTLHFDEIDQVLAEAERLAASEVRTTGNHSFGQILEHLARTLDIVTGHVSGVPIPLPIRLMMRLARPWILSRPMKPGFNLPSKAQAAFWPSEEVTVAEGMAHFREAFARFRQADSLPKHPLFGTMTRSQHDQLQCRHCELHLGFVHPST